MTRKRHIFWPALLAVTLAACAVSPTGRRQLALVSEDSAIAASDEAYAMQIGELRKEGKSRADYGAPRRAGDDEAARDGRLELEHGGHR